jgi:hypothetical protein
MTVARYLVIRPSLSCALLPALKTNFSSSEVDLPTALPDARNLVAALPYLATLPAVDHERVFHQRVVDTACLGIKLL